ncbi:hypothetical protein CSUI_009268 [Cystoisospora suis]|uniref:Uncharacterized protein n=1 Tax=Cystoisospora suis TaxID=483139 RepID=A0A2C6KKA7_9APIC|nr:hypothetical protein CSUI_009268 [Cystoisospora suis]
MFEDYFSSPYFLPPTPSSSSCSPHASASPSPLGRHSRVSPNTTSADAGPPRADGTLMSSTEFCSPQKGSLKRISCILRSGAASPANAQQDQSSTAVRSTREAFCRFGEHTVSVPICQAVCLGNPGNSAATVRDPSPHLRGVQPQPVSWARSSKTLLESCCSPFAVAVPEGRDSNEKTYATSALDAPRSRACVDAPELAARTSDGGVAEKSACLEDGTDTAVREERIDGWKAESQQDGTGSRALERSASGEAVGPVTERKLSNVRIQSEEALLPTSQNRIQDKGSEKSIGSSLGMVEVAETAAERGTTKSGNQGTGDEARAAEKGTMTGIVASFKRNGFSAKVSHTRVTPLPQLDGWTTGHMYPQEGTSTTETLPQETTVATGATAFAETKDTSCARTFHGEEHTASTADSTLEGVLFGVTETALSSDVTMPKEVECQSVVVIKESSGQISGDNPKVELSSAAALRVQEARKFFMNACRPSVPARRSSGHRSRASGDPVEVPADSNPSPQQQREAEKKQDRCGEVSSRRTAAVARRSVLSQGEMLTGASAQQNPGEAPAVEMRLRSGSSGKTAIQASHYRSVTSDDGNKRKPFSVGAKGSSSSEKETKTICRRWTRGKAKAHPTSSESSPGPIGHSGITASLSSLMVSGSSTSLPSPPPSCLPVPNSCSLLPSSTCSALPSASLLGDLRELRGVCYAAAEEHQLRSIMSLSKRRSRPSDTDKRRRRSRRASSALPTPAASGHTVSSNARSPLVGPSPLLSLKGCRSGPTLRVTGRASAPSSEPAESPRISSEDGTHFLPTRQRSPHEQRRCSEEIGLESKQRASSSGDCVRVGCSDSGPSFLEAPCPMELRPVTSHSPDVVSSEENASYREQELGRRKEVSTRNCLYDEKPSPREELALKAGHHCMLTNGGDGSASRQLLSSFRGQDTHAEVQETLPQRSAFPEEKESEVTFSQEETSGGIASGTAMSTGDHMVVSQAPACAEDVSSVSASSSPLLRSHSEEAPEREFYEKAGSPSSDLPSTEKPAEEMAQRSKGATSGHTSMTTVEKEDSGVNIETTAGSLPPCAHERGARSFSSHSSPNQTREGGTADHSLSENHLRVREEASKPIVVPGSFSSLLLAQTDEKEPSVENGSHPVLPCLKADPSPVLGSPTRPCLASSARLASFPSTPQQEARTDGVAIAVSGRPASLIPHPVRVHLHSGDVGNGRGREDIFSVPTSFLLSISPPEEVSVVVPAPPPSPVSCNGDQSRENGLLTVSAAPACPTCTNLTKQDGTQATVSPEASCFPTGVAVSSSGIRSPRPSSTVSSLHAANASVEKEASGSSSSSPSPPLQNLSQPAGPSPVHLPEKKPDCCSQVGPTASGPQAFSASFEACRPFSTASAPLSQPSGSVEIQAEFAFTSDKEQRLRVGSSSSQSTGLTKEGSAQRQNDGLSQDITRADEHSSSFSSVCSVASFGTSSVAASLSLPTPSSFPASLPSSLPLLSSSCAVSSAAPSCPSLPACAPSSSSLARSPTAGILRQKQGLVSPCRVTNRRLDSPPRPVELPVRNSRTEGGSQTSVIFVSLAADPPALPALNACVNLGNDSGGIRHKTLSCSAVGTKQRKASCGSSGGKQTQRTSTLVGPAATLMLSAGNAAACVESSREVTDLRGPKSSNDGPGPPSAVCVDLSCSSARTLPSALSPWHPVVSCSPVSPRGRVGPETSASESEPQGPGSKGCSAVPSATPQGLDSFSGVVSDLRGAVAKSRGSPSELLEAVENAHGKCEAITNEDTVPELQGNDSEHFASGGEKRTCRSRGKAPSPGPSECREENGKGEKEGEGDDNGGEQDDRVTNRSREEASKQGEKDVVVEHQSAEVRNDSRKSELQANFIDNLSSERISEEPSDARWRNKRGAWCREERELPPAISPESVGEFLQDSATVRQPQADGPTVLERDESSSMLNIGQKEGSGNSVKVNEHGVPPRGGDMRSATNFCRESNDTPQEKSFLSGSNLTHSPSPQCQLTCRSSGHAESPALVSKPLPPVTDETGEEQSPGQLPAQDSPLRRASVCREGEYDPACSQESVTRKSTEAQEMTRCVMREVEGQDEDLDQHGWQAAFGRESEEVKGVRSAEGATEISRKCPRRISALTHDERASTCLGRRGDIQAPDTECYPKRRYRHEARLSKRVDGQRRSEDNDIQETVQRRTSSDAVTRYSQENAARQRKERCSQGEKRVSFSNTCSQGAPISTRRSVTASRWSRPSCSPSLASNSCQPSFSLKAPSFLETSCESNRPPSFCASLPPVNPTEERLPLQQRVWRKGMEWFQEGRWPALFRSLAGGGKFFLKCRETVSTLASTAVAVAVEKLLDDEARAKLATALPPAFADLPNFASLTAGAEVLDFSRTRNVGGETPSAASRLLSLSPLQWQERGISNRKSHGKSVTYPDTGQETALGDDGVQSLVFKLAVPATVYGVDVLVFTGEGKLNTKSEVEGVFFSLDVASMVDEAAEGGSLGCLSSLPCETSWIPVLSSQRLQPDSTGHTFFALDVEQSVPLTHFRVSTRRTPPLQGRGQRTRRLTGGVGARNDSRVPETDVSLHQRNGKRRPSGLCEAPGSTQDLECCENGESHVVFMPEIARFSVYGEVWRAPGVPCGPPHLPQSAEDSSLGQQSLQDVGDLLSGAAVVGWETEQKTRKGQSENEQERAADEEGPPLKKMRKSWGGAGDACSDVEWRQKEKSGEAMLSANQLGECRQEILLSSRGRKRRSSARRSLSIPEASESELEWERQRDQGGFDEQNTWKNITEVTIRLSARTSLRRIEITWRSCPENNGMDKRDGSCAFSPSSSSSFCTDPGVTSPKVSDQDNRTPVDIQVAGWDATADEKTAYMNLLQQRHFFRRTDTSSGIAWQPLGFSSRTLVMRDDRSVLHTPEAAASVNERHQGKKLKQAFEGRLMRSSLEMKKTSKTATAQDNDSADIRSAVGGDASQGREGSQGREESPLMVTHARLRFSGPVTLYRVKFWGIV